MTKQWKDLENQKRISGNLTNLPEHVRKSSNKTKGTNFENRVRTYYRKRGYHVIRVAGSFGPVDLICIKPGERDIYVQCKDIKTNYYSKQEMQAFKDFCSLHERRCVWAYNYHKKLSKNGRMKFANLETRNISSITQDYLAGKYEA